MDSKLNDGANVLILDSLYKNENSKFSFWPSILNSEFKIITSLNNPVFNLIDELGNKIDLICIRVAENKYCCKIRNPRFGKYCLKIFDQKSNFEIEFYLKKNEIFS